MDADAAPRMGIFTLRCRHGLRCNRTAARPPSISLAKMTRLALSVFFLSVLIQAPWSSGGAPERNLSENRARNGAGGGIRR